MEDKEIRELAKEQKCGWTKLELRIERLNTSLQILALISIAAIVVLLKIASSLDEIDTSLMMIVNNL